MGLHAQGLGRVHQVGMRHGKLELVHDKGLLHTGFQQFHLHGLVVGNAEVPHFPGGVEIIKCLCHFLRFHQGIRVVEQEHIQIIRAQTF